MISIKRNAVLTLDITPCIKPRTAIGFAGQSHRKRSSRLILLAVLFAVLELESCQADGQEPVQQRYGALLLHRIGPSVGFQRGVIDDAHLGAFDRDPVLTQDAESPGEILGRHPKQRSQ